MQSGLLLAVAFFTFLKLCSASEDEVINVILIGATGNLAQKYLWQSLRNIDFAGNTAPLKIWPAGTRAGMQHAIDTILATNVTYDEPNSKDKFHTRVAAYHRLRDTADFSQLNQDIITSNAGKREIGRIVYMSVPPKFFGGIASEINLNLRPASANHTYLKVIVEKPFGVDLSSALQLSRDLFASLGSEEVLCVDHYMGKDALRGIREFREANPHYLSHEFISQLARVDVQMVETEDCQGRTSFYSEVGVMRDTMQNHLMMMLALFTMEMDGGAEDESHRRSKTVQLLHSGMIKQMSQYSTYHEHEREDHLQYYGTALDKLSYVPTYAQVELKFKPTSPFGHVPFIFTSGKALPKRRAFLRATLANGEHLTFMVQGELDGIKGPAIHATAGLKPFVCPANNKLWHQVNDHLCIGPKDSPSAYQVLLNDLLQGNFDSFVSIPEVLHSWRIWTSLVSAETSNTYLPGGIGLDDELNGGEGKPRQEL